MLRTQNSLLNKIVIPECWCRESRRSTGSPINTLGDDGHVNWAAI